MAYFNSSQIGQQSVPAQSAVNTDLITDIVSGYLDISALQAVSMQIVASAGISAGAITFEQSVDAVNWKTWVVTEVTSITVNPLAAAITIAASTQRIFLGIKEAPFVRCRISTAFVGGTVQGYASLQSVIGPRLSMNVQQNAGSLAVVPLSSGGTLHTLNAAASTNATSVKASSGSIQSASFSNMAASIKYIKFYDKATAPTVGTDVPIFVLPIPANGQATLTPGFLGMRLNNGIAYAITGAQALLDTTAVAAGDVQVWMTYN